MPKANKLNKIIFRNFQNLKSIKKLFNYTKILFIAHKYLFTYKMDSNNTLDDFVKLKKDLTTTWSTGGLSKKRKADDLELEEPKLKKLNFPDLNNEKFVIKQDPWKNTPNFNTNINLTNGTPSTLDTYEDFINGLETWRDPLKTFINSGKMKTIYNFIKRQFEINVIHPPKELIFNAFSKTSWDNLKVVIIGQDPYPTAGNAMGLSFSVNKGVAIPKSLLNIFKCLEKDPKLNFIRPKHGDLTKWVKQGVLLLNTTLTVVDRKASSHIKTSGWMEFTDNVIQKINSEKKGIVFLLWGNLAIQKKKILEADKHYVIENIHPSPLACGKGDFTKSDQFSKANSYLIKEGKEEIDWTLEN